MVYMKKLYVLIYLSSKQTSLAFNICELDIFHKSKTSIFANISMKACYIHV